jgi:hypothetical protein
MAKGRFSSVETFWLMVGLRRFQSNVAIMMATTTINNKKIPAVQEITLVVLVIFIPFPDDLFCKTIVQTKGSGLIRGSL